MYIYKIIKIHVNGIVRKKKERKADQRFFMITVPIFQ